jgi:LPS-assembly protein
VRRRGGGWFCALLLASPLLAQDPSLEVTEAWPFVPEQPGEIAPAEGAETEGGIPILTPVIPEEVPTGPGEESQRIRFDVPFPVERGGGTAVGSAGSIEYTGADYVVASGGVEFAYQQYRLQAERIEVDLASKRVIADGGVILDEGPRRLSGARLEFDLESETGTLYEAQAFVDPDIYFTGEEISKTGENTYTVKHGMMTSCLAETPAWSFRLGKGKVTVDGYARASNVTVRAKKLPLMYWPYILFPADRGRKSGFLIPNLGHSRSRGQVLNLAYYQVLGRSYDATLFADLYEEDYTGIGAEFRYAPTVGTRGILEGYSIDDGVQDETRWKARALHASDDLPFGLRGVVNFIEYSDFNFFRDFEREFNDVAVRTLNSTGYVTGNWGNHSFNLLAQDTETFIRTDVSVIQRQLPEIEYKIRSTQIGSLPLYFQMDSSAHYFQAERTDVYEQEWQRADISPRLTAPLSYWPWLSLSVSAGGRVTHYTDSLDESRRNFTGEEITRTFPVGTASMVGPSFSKIFDWKAGRFGKFKHIIEPRMSYLFIGDFEDQDLVTLFDEIDTLRKQNIFTAGLVNRLLAKPSDPEALEGAREIASFELAQAFSLNEDQPFQISRDGEIETTRGPILGRLRFSPGTKISLETRFTFNTLFDRLQDSSLSGYWNAGKQSFGVTWFTRFDPEEGDTSTHQVRLFTQLTLWPSRLTLGSQVNYDFVLGLLQQMRHVLTYQAQCWGFVVEVRELRSLNREDRDIRFALSLKNIGTFLDLTSGTRHNY